jgi:septum site-determining protein MinC
MTKSAELKGRSFTLSSLQLIDDDIQQATAYLAEKVQQAPGFFRAAPLVIDVTNAGERIDFVTLKESIKNIGMVPVGISGCNSQKLQQQALQAGLAILNAGPQIELPSVPSTEPTVDTTIESQTMPQPTRTIYTPVRSGQQIYAPNCDLVIVNNVSAGAEIIADGSIHIYGTLRGRAIAGASGEKSAQIFCQNLQPELISIAGNYWLSDKITEEYWGKNVVISLSEHQLTIDHLTV